MLTHSKRHDERPASAMRGPAVVAVMSWGLLVGGFRGAESQPQAQAADATAIEASAAAERHPGKGDTYTITSVMQILKPVNLADMNDGFPSLARPTL